MAVISCGPVGTCTAVIDNQLDNAYATMAAQAANYSKTLDVEDGDDA